MAKHSQLTALSNRGSKSADHKKQHEDGKGVQC